MARHRTFVREEKYPSYFINAQQDFLSVLAAGFVVTRLNTTTIRVPGGAGNDRAVVAVDGRYRWRDANTDRAHPGGAAGTYAIFATAKNNSVTNTPVTDTDLTDYAFDLRIVADGSTPAIVAGTVDAFRKVATCQWDGAQITRITQLVPAVGQHSSTHAIGGSDALSLADIGAASATGLADEIAAREVGDSPYAAGRVVTWGGDTNLYRAGANALKTDDNFSAASVTGDAGAPTHVRIGNPGGGAATVFFGPAEDTTLFRNAPGTLRTPGALVVDGALTSGQLTAHAAAATLNATQGSTNWIRSPKNTVTLYLGDNDTTGAYGQGEFSAAVRFNGVGTGYGDVAYYPNALDGHFRFYRDGNNVGVTRADVAVASLFASANVQVPSGASLFFGGIADRITGVAGDHLDFWVAGASRAKINSASQLEVGGVLLPTGGSVSSPGYVQLVSGAVNDQIMFKRGGGAVETARFNASGHLVIHPSNIVGWSAAAGTGTPDTYLQRRAAGAISTPGQLEAAGALLADQGNTGARLYFGSGLDTSMYRSGAGALITPGTLQTGGSLTIGGSLNFNGTFVNLAAGAVVQWNAGDASVRRAAAGWVEVTNNLQAVNQIVSYSATSAQIVLGNNSGTPIINFGLASDAFLWRVAANRLSTGALDLTGALKRGVLAAVPSIGIYDGMEVLVQTTAMADNNVGPWLIRYRAAMTGLYKWEVIGAKPWLTRFRDTTPGSATTSYGSMTTSVAGNRVRVDVPFSGEYEVRYGFQETYASSGVPAQESWVVALSEDGAGIKNDGRSQADLDADSIHTGWLTTNDPSLRQGNSSACHVTANAAGKIALYQRNGITIAWPVANPWLEVTPVRLL